MQVYLIGWRAAILRPRYFWAPPVAASIGGFIGPMIIGHLSQRTGSFDAGFVFMIGCWMIAAMLVLLCPRERAT